MTGPTRDELISAIGSEKQFPLWMRAGVMTWLNLAPKREIAAIGAGLAEILVAIKAGDSERLRALLTEVGIGGELVDVVAQQVAEHAEELRSLNRDQS